LRLPYTVKESVAYSLGLTLGCVGTYAATRSEHGPWFLLTMPLAWLGTFLTVRTARRPRGLRAAANCGRLHRSYFSYFPLRCRCSSRDEGHHLVLTALGWRCRRPA
jgi:hypothetical protein